MNVIQTLTTGHTLPLCVFTLSSILRHFLHLIGPPPTLPQESICQMEWWLAGSGGSCESGTYGVLDCVFALVPGEISQPEAQHQPRCHLAILQCRV